MSATLTFATLFYNNSDICSNRLNTDQQMKHYCNEKGCLRKFILHLDLVAKSKKCAAVFARPFKKSKQSMFKKKLDPAMMKLKMSFLFVVTLKNLHHQIRTVKRVSLYFEDAVRSTTAGD